jgi:rRNA-processing protein FCF1
MGNGTMIKAIISDANILIDYVSANTKILSLASKHLYEIYFPTTLLKEVPIISQQAIKTLGIQLIEPELKQVIEAAQHDTGTSPEDRLCYVLARDNHWACATNDKKLRRLCSNNNVICLWGFEIMVELVRQSVLSVEEAVKTAQKISAINPRITKSVVADFIAKVNG